MRASAQTWRALRWCVITARRASSANAELWKNIESNTEIFNPRKLPNILVPLAGLSRAEQEDARFVRLLQRAVMYLEGNGLVVQVVGAKGSAAIIKAAEAIRSNEAKGFRLAWLAALTAQVPHLEDPQLAELAVELHRYHVLDQRLWKALADSVLRRTELQPRELVAFLDAFRRGFKPEKAIRALCQRILACHKDFTPKQCVGVVASVCRLNVVLDYSIRLQVVQYMLDTWLAASSWSSTSEVISLAVSLGSLPSGVSPRIESFILGASGWATEMARSGKIGAEDLVVLLWALKQLTPVGLARYHELVELGVWRIREEAKFEDFSFVRLHQALELLFGAKHALAGASTEELFEDIEGRLMAALAAQMVSLDCAQVAKVLTKGEQGGESFWRRCSVLTEAVLERTVKLARDAMAAELHVLLDAIASSTLARSSHGLEAVIAMVAQRKDAQLANMAAVLRALEQATSREAPEASEATRRERQGFDAEMPLSPVEMAERLGKLGKSKKSNQAELAMVAERFLAAIDGLNTGQLLPALQHVLFAGRKRITREPLLLEVVERLGDQVAIHSRDLPTLQLISALDAFSDLVLPYHLLFESVVVELQRKQPLSWQQVIAVLEAFSVVRIRIPELLEIYSRLRRQQELARLPTMGLVRFLSSATLLDLADEAGEDVREIISRILAETTPQRPLPQDDIVSVVESLHLSGVVLPDMQLRHVFSWVATLRPGALKERELTILRDYVFLILAQEDNRLRSSLQRMPVEIQSYISQLLCHPAPNWMKPTGEETLRFQEQVSHLLLEADPVPKAVPVVSLGPAGQADAEVAGTTWLFDGPEAFFLPLMPLRYTPQERQRLWLLRQLFSNDTARHAIMDFYPAAADWPKKGGPRRLNWQEWEQAGSDARKHLLGLELKISREGFVEAEVAPAGMP